MSLSSILKEIEKERPNADMVVNMEYPDTYKARLGLKNAAIDKIKYLKMDYSDQLMASTVFIVVSGPNRDEFTNLASGENFGCFSVDPENFYRNLVSRIDPKLFGRESPRHLFNVVSNILEDKAMELGIRSYRFLNFNEKYNSLVNKAEDLVPLVRDAINDQVGSEIVGIDAIHSILDKAITKGHSATVTPLVLNTANEKFALDLKENLKRLSNKVFLVVAGKTKAFQAAKDALVVKNVNEESVGEALSVIRNKVLV